MKRITRKPVRRKPIVKRSRPMIELLEDRTLLATLTVTGSGDTVEVDGQVTLREAIISANNNADVNADVVTLEAYGTDTINFNIPGAGLHTIHVGATGLGGLPAITGPVIIDGYTQPGAVENTNAVDSMLGVNTVLRIELDGTNAGAGVNGLTTTGGSSTIRGLVINRFNGLNGSNGHGVFLFSTSTSNVVEGNFIGTDASGTVALGNNGSGVFIAGDDFGNAIGNRIGGTTPAARNLISGNTGSGVSVARASNNVVEGNLIGTDASGKVDLGNNGQGVLLTFGVTSNRVGGTTSAARNIISGNSGSGVALGELSFTNQVLGNFIGTDVTGTQDLGNGGSGVSASSQNFNNNGTVIGGTAAGARNIISGNGSFGVSLNFMNNSVVQGNYIGTDLTGTVAIGNANGGIGLFGSSNTTIGGDDDDDGFLDGIVQARNLISGNPGEGGISGSASGTVVLGNFIGTQADGISPLGNGGPAPFNRPGINAFNFGGSVIGGTAPGAGNVIAFSTGDGIAGINNLKILGNSIFGNGFRGVSVSFGGPVTILGNSIFANAGVPGLAGLGIDLGGNGVTANDTGDADTGANNLQNFPVLIEVLSTAVDSAIFGSLNSVAQTDFLIQFFANDAADPSGHGEGQTFIGETIVHTNSAGNVNFAADVAVLLTPDQQVTATATRLFDHDADPNTPSVPTDTSEFSQAISGAASVLELDGPTIERDLPAGKEFTFRLNVPPGVDARLTAHFTDPRIGEILVRVGDFPDVNSSADRVVAFVNPDPEFLLAGVPVPYFISVRGTSTANVPLGHFSLTALALGMEIEGITPNHGSNAGQVTTTIVGARLTSETIFSLVAADGVERAAAAVVQQSETTFFVTFNLAGLAAGLHDVKATDGPNTALVDDAFTVTIGNPGLFAAHLITPSRLLNGREAVLIVEYANLGETDIPAPLLIVQAFNSIVTPVSVAPQLKTVNGGGGGGGSSTGGNSVSIPPQVPPPPPPPIPPDAVVQVLAISQTGPAGVLPPGARGRIEVRFQDNGAVAPGFHPTLRFRLINADEEIEIRPAGPNEETFDLAAAKDDIRPPTVSPEAWDVLFSNLLARFGTTVGSYVQALRDAATYLSRYGIYVSDIDRLLSIYFAQADNALPGASLHAAIDAAAPASGVPLVWGRTFAPTISRRFDLGILGRGWSHPWDLRLSRDAETNDVQIRTPGGTRRFSEQPNGSFVGSSLDPAQLTLQSGVFSLRETDGTVSRFNETTGLLLDVTDRNGHKVTLGYLAGTPILVQLLHSNGDRFVLGYTAGRLTSLTDQAGRVTTYEYDVANEHLKKVIGPDGVWEYAYETTAGARNEHALESVTAPDGTHVFYDYDGLGRLAGTARDENAEAVTIDYGSVGEVFITDAETNTTSLFFNEFGQLLEARDALDRSARLDYDLVRRLDRVTLPQDTVSLYDFDDNGNLIFVVKPDGGSQRFIYDTTFNLPDTIRDERNIPLRYTYDAQGNLKGIIHADGSVEQFTPDPDGNVSQSINRRGQVIDYTYEDRGLLERKDHADGTFEAFTYDDRGNLKTATDEAGTTTFTYDDPADRLTKVTYADGRFLQYTYDDIRGRRIRLEDQTGFVVKYRYDTAGRIDELTDGSDARLVLYTYDATGRLKREDNGNLTFTTYDYDDAGQLTSLVNHLPDSAVSSRFDYTYDDLGRRTSVTTLEGLTTFGYDAIGQLTLVILPDSRTIQYQYDAAGNRTAVIDNGVATNYKPNNLNQYARIGAFDRTYDPDGNLITDEAGGPRGTTFTYDDESRLLTWVDGVLSVGYEYDALGNRTAKTEGGVRTEYLIDPLGLTNVVAEYDSAGNLIARYVHGGFGLVSRHDSAGAAAFYDFDAMSSTVAMTDGTANIVNRYSYLPFGEALTNSETIVNPFEFVGQFGVQRDASGLDFMRARYYSSDDGRFVNEDPIGVLGGLNLYRYVNNQPVQLIDPSGLSEFLGLADLDIDEAARGFEEVLNTVETTALDVLTPRDIELNLPNPREVPLIGVGVRVLVSAGLATTVSLAIDALVAAAPAIFIVAAPFIAYYAATSESSTYYGDQLFDLLNPDFGIPAPPGTPLDDDSTNQVGSVDPNDIIGPTGFGPEGFLQADSSLFYTIRFENLATATAPAQTVVVTQTLDPDLDLTTFEFVSFGMGASVVNLPAGRSSFLLKFDLRPDRNLLLDVGADLNFETGVITWTFTSLDPATLELPNDPDGDIGFLPPNQNPPEGEGFLTYVVRAKPGLPTGTRIDALASIVFDVNAAIDTPAIFNTFDGGPPTSSVAPLPATIQNTSFTLNWSGSDDAGGSGIASFDVFVSDNGGAFTLFLDNTAQTSATFTGQLGHTYRFFSVAVDNVGLVQPTPAQPQATVTLVAPPPPPTGTRATAVKIGKRLVLTGDAGDNQVRIVLDGKRGTVTVRGLNDTLVNGTADVVSFQKVKSVTAQLLAGDDLFEVSGKPFEKAVTLDGGAGDDVYRVAVKKGVKVVDAEGTDVLNFSGLTQGVFIQLGNGALPSGLPKKLLRRDVTGRLDPPNLLRFEVAGEMETIIGTNLADFIVGGASANVLIGQGGADVLVGGLGRNVLIGGRTTFGDDAQAWRALRAEWLSPRTLDVRTKNLQDGTGSADRLNGAFFLNAGETVLDDNALDLVFANLGEDLLFS